MGDTTNVQVYVWSCPADRRADVREILADAGLRAGWFGDHSAPGRPDVQLGEVYGTNDGVGDLATEVIDTLIEEVPEIVVSGWSDPAYEWLGAGGMYVPELGRFGFESDATGNPVFTADQVLDAIGRGRDLERFLGKPWVDAIERVKKVAQ